MPASGLWPSSTDKKLLADPVMVFMGHKIEESTDRSLENPESSAPHSPSDEKSKVEPDSSAVPAIEQASIGEDVHEETIKLDVRPDPAEGRNIASAEETKIIAPEFAEADSKSVPIELSEPNTEHVEESDPLNYLQQKDITETVSFENSGSLEAKPSSHVDEAESTIAVPHELQNVIDQAEIADEQKTHEEETVEIVSPMQAEEASIDSQIGSGTEPPGSNSPTLDETSEVVPETISQEGVAITRTFEGNQDGSDHKTNVKEHLSLESTSSNTLDSRVELEKVKKDMQMMETALLGAARQAQVFDFLQLFF